MSPLGGLLAGLAVPLGLIVGVGAIAVFRHASPGPGGLARNTLQALESEYGVLQRPQTALTGPTEALDVRA